MWCWRTAHETCLNCVSSNLVEECDFGQFSRLLLKPNLISSSETFLNATNELALSDVTISTSKVSLMHNWTPLIVFANPKSGNNDADIIAKSLTTLLNPLQVI